MIKGRGLQGLCGVTGMENQMEKQLETGGLGFGV